MDGQYARDGFSLIELVIVVLILGIVAAVTVPRMSNVASDAETAALARDLRVLGDHAQVLYAKNGHWPNTLFSTQIPNGFEAQLQDGSFSGRPLDGVWAWFGSNPPFGHVGPGIFMWGTMTDDRLSRVQKIDQSLDDGVLETGSVRMTKRSSMYILQLILEET